MSETQIRVLGPIVSGKHVEYFIEEALLTTFALIVSLCKASLITL